MAQEREDHEVALEIFHTQEAVTIRIRKVMIDSVTKDLIVELEDEDTSFSKVKLRDLIAAVQAWPQQISITINAVRPSRYSRR